MILAAAGLAQAGNALLKDCLRPLEEHAAHLAATKAVLPSLLVLPQYP